MTRLERIAVAGVRAWARAYTAPLPPSARDTRRAELAADTHDHLADLRARAMRGRPAAAEIARRLVRGMPDDLLWALTTFVEDAMPRTRLLALTGWAYALVVSVLGLLSAVAGLAEGWRELPGHWWSTLAAMAVVVSLVGLGATVLATARHQTGTGDQAQ
jgi:hypothetical protein